MAAGNLAGALPAGELIRRAGLRNALVVCQIAVPAVLCARVLSPAFAYQLPVAVLAGMTLSLWAVCVSPAVAAVTGEKQRALAFSLLFSMGIGLGAAGGFIGSRMPAVFSHLVHHPGLPAADQLTLIASCCLATLGIVPMSRLSIPQYSIARSPRPLFSPSMRRFLSAIALWGLVTGSFVPFGSVFFAVRFHLPLEHVGTIFSMSQLSQVGAVLLSPLLFRRFGVPLGIVATQLATGLCFVALAVSNRSIPASIVFVILAAVQYMSEPGIYSQLMNIVPEEHRGGASASMTLAIAATQLIAGALAGWAFTHLGYSFAFAIIALIAGAAAFVFKTTVRAASSSPSHPVVEVHAE